MRGNTASRWTTSALVLLAFLVRGPVPGQTQSEPVDESASGGTGTLPQAREAVASALQFAAPRAHLTLIEQNSDEQLKQLVRKLHRRKMSVGPPLPRPLEEQTAPLAGSAQYACRRVAAPPACPNYRPLAVCEYLYGSSGTGGTHRLSNYKFCRVPSGDDEIRCGGPPGKRVIHGRLKGFVNFDRTRSFCRECTRGFARRYVAAARDSAVARRLALDRAREHGCEAEHLRDCPNEFDHLNAVARDLLQGHEAFKDGNLPEDTEPAVARYVARHFARFEFLKQSCARRCRHGNADDAISCSVVLFAPCAGIVGSVCHDELGNLEKVQLRQL